MNVLSELKIAGIEAAATDADYVSIKCPFHEDKSPTLRVSTKDGHYRCFSAACNASGVFPQLISHLTGERVEAVSARLEALYGGKKRSDISLTRIEKCHQLLWEKPDLLEQLRIRGVDANTIRLRKLGADDRGRIVIPIMGMNFQWETAKFYSPGAEQFKMTGQRGRAAKPRLYPIDQMGYDEVVVVGGEIKALATSIHANPHKVGAVSSTMGEGNWSQRLTDQFTKCKRIYVANDIDAAGQRANEIVAASLSTVCDEVYTIRLPFSAVKGGADDYFAAGGTWEDFIKSAVRWTNVPPDEELIEEAPLRVSLRKAYSPELTAMPLEVKAVISAVDTVPYHIPHKVSFDCGRDGDVCAMCPVKLHGRDRVFIHEIQPDSDTVLALTENARIDVDIAKSAGIPHRCPGHSVEVLSYLRVDEVRLSEQVTLAGAEDLKSHQPAYVTNETDQEPTQNATYLLRGKMQPHPRSQRSIFVVKEQEPAEDDIQAWVPTGQVIAEMQKYLAPKELTVEGVDEAMRRRAFNAERHITRIYNRLDMHIVCDLVYHSPLFLKVAKRNRKGWLEAVLIGDSANGKSECTERLMEFYGLGDKVDCKNATAVGLVGGLQPGEGSKRMFVVWGALPRNDKGLVLLEELKGLAPEAFAKLTDTRSSGMAMITKVETKKARARCRILATSNPRSDRKMATYPFGVQAIIELAGTPEDTRRFDLAVSVTDSTVKRLKSDHPDGEPIPEHALRSSVMMAWSRTVNGVSVSVEAEQAALEHSVALCKKYTSTIPLIDAGSTDTKLLRIAAAAAAATASADVDGNIILLPVHVDWAAMFLQRLYDAPDMKYDMFSMKEQSLNSLQNPEALRGIIESSAYAKDLVDYLRTTMYVDSQDVADFGGYSKDEADQAVASFRRSRAIVRVNSGKTATYAKTPAFIQFLESLDVDNMQPPM